MIEEIIQRFKDYLYLKCITQEEAAAALSITQEHLSRVLNRKRNPSTTLLIKMEHFMEESI